MVWLVLICETHVYLLWLYTPRLHCFCVGYSDISDFLFIMWTFDFFLNGILLGVGLAMDAFCVSLANGMNEPKMPFKKTNAIGLTFSVFQGIMPLLGWLLCHTVLTYFKVFEHFIPWIAISLLGYIGGKMLYEGIKNKGEEKPATTFIALLLQGIATSIDALSAGLTIASYDFLFAAVTAILIASVTYLISIVGVFIGKKFGTAISGKATVFGGIILIIIGIEIFIKCMINLYS